MGCGAFAYDATGSVNCEALMIATGQNLKRLLQKRGWGRRPFPVGAVMAVPLLASSPEKRRSNRTSILRSRKVALAGMISFGPNLRRSYASIPCCSLHILFLISLSLFILLPLSHSLSSFLL